MRGVVRQVRTLGHTCKGSCICRCVKRRGADVFKVNPKCPVLGHSSVVDAVAISPDGTRVVSAWRDSSAKIWVAETGVLVSSYGGRTL